MRSVDIPPRQIKRRNLRWNITEYKNRWDLIEYKLKQFLVLGYIEISGFHQKKTNEKIYLIFVMH